MRRGSYPNPRLRGPHPAGGVAMPAAYYRAMRRVAQVGFCALWKVRVFNRHHEPDRGGVLYVSNHQSFLDPVLVGLGLRRPLNYMARESLFRLPLFRGLIRSLNAFPVRRAAADTAALKEAVRRLEAGHALAVFAEGTRTHDGRIGPLLPGVALLAQRAAAWTVPVLIDGAFEAWPRREPLPAPGSIVVEYGKPLSQAEALALSPEELLHRIRRALMALQADVRHRTGQPTLTYETDPPVN